MFKYCSYGSSSQTPESQPLRNFCAGPPIKVKSWSPLPVWKFLRKRSFCCYNHFPQVEAGKNTWEIINRHLSKFQSNSQSWNASLLTIASKLQSVYRMWADLFQSACWRIQRLTWIKLEFSRQVTLFSYSFIWTFCSFFIAFLKMSLETSHSNSNIEIAFAFEILLQVSCGLAILLVKGKRDTHMVLKPEKV